VYTTSGGTLAHILSYAKNGDRSTSDVVITEVVPDHATVNAAGSTAGWSCADGSPAGTVCALCVGNPNAEENDTVELDFSPPLTAVVASLQTITALTLGRHQGRLVCRHPVMIAR
jgi:hypothetical protein